MIRAAASAGLLLVASCATADLAGKPPERSWHSAGARSAVAECLMNRLAGGGDLRVHREDQGNVTQVSASSGMAHVAVFLFTLRDSPAGGSDVDLRRFNRMAPGLSNAETCL